jgi:hypothetical protein
MQKSKFVEGCHICGMPVTKFQVALKFDTYATNFVEHSEGDLSMVVCLECYEKIKVNYQGGMRKAMVRYKEAMEQ